MKRQIFIIVPSPHPTGPVKGAYALANALAASRAVTMVTLKDGPGVDAPLDRRVSCRTLAAIDGGWRAKLTTYRSWLAAAGGRAEVASISMCLSADAVNCFCRSQALTIASVRGNLVRNYQMDYGFPGRPLAAAHLAALRRVDRIVAFTTAMARQVSFYSRTMPAVIGNFVDELALERYRNTALRTGPFRFVFVGSLTTRKRAGDVVAAIDALRRRGIDAVADIVGGGPVAGAVEREIKQRSVSDAIMMHGHVADPYPVIARADVMVLPSLSEGVARASIEALYLGVPCVLRDADGSAELMADPAAGSLFLSERQLPDIMLAVAHRSRETADRPILLPTAFRQHEAIRRYEELVDAS